MKKTFFTVLFAALTMGVAAQTTNAEETKCDTTIINSDNATLPIYPGGEQEMMKFLQKNIKYPEIAEKYGVEGRVIMSFIVDKNGKPKDITAKDCKLERFNTTKFNQEPASRQAQLKEQFALLFAKEGARVISKMPKWTPGTVDGKPANVSYSLPIKFSMPK